MKKKKKFPLFTLIFVLAVFGGLGYGGYTMWQNKNAFKIEIIIDKINVREDHDLYSKQVGTVKKKQVYKVIDIYLDDPRYVWYKIKVNGDTKGWIASGRNEKYVKEYNNPESHGDETFIADYTKPKIIFYENEVTFMDLGAINYDHLNIEDETECTIKHEVYYEEFPKDSDEPQYWIKYIVTDAAGNTNSKVQKIIFLEEPDPSKVKRFEDMKK